MRFQIQIFEKALLLKITGPKGSVSPISIKHWKEEYGTYSLKRIEIINLISRELKINFELANEVWKHCAIALNLQQNIYSFVL